MFQEIMIGFAIASAYPLGAVMGIWTQDEGINLRSSNFRSLIKKIGLPLSIFYGIILGLSWNSSIIDLVSLLIFGTILAQTSIITKSNKITKNIWVEGFVFFSMFLVLSFI